MYPTALIFGTLAGCLALLIELVVLNIGGSITYTPELPDFGSILVVSGAVFIEECARLLLLRQFFARYFSATYQWSAIFAVGLSYGIGFSLLEIGLIVSQGSFPLFPLATIVLIHSGLSLLLAFALARRLPFPVPFVFAFGTLLHLIYNLSLVLFGK